jgi:hypothetical protein
LDVQQGILVSIVAGYDEGWAGSIDVSDAKNQGSGSIPSVGLLQNGEVAVFLDLRVSSAEKMLYVDDLR